MSVELVTATACQQKNFTVNPLVEKTVLMAERAKQIAECRVIERLETVWDGRFQLSEQQRDFIKNAGCVLPLFRVYDSKSGTVFAYEEMFEDAPGPEEVLLTFRSPETFTPQKLKKGKFTVDFSIPDLGIRFRAKWLVSGVMSRSIRSVINDENSDGLSIVRVNPRGKHYINEYYNAWVVGFRK